MCARDLNLGPHGARHPNASRFGLFLLLALFSAGGAAFAFLCYRAALEGYVLPSAICALQAAVFAGGVALVGRRG